MNNDTDHLLNPDSIAIIKENFQQIEDAVMEDLNRLLCTNEPIGTEIVRRRIWVHGAVYLNRIDDKLWLNSEPVLDWFIDRSNRIKLCLL